MVRESSTGVQQMKNNQQFKDEEPRDKIQCQEAGCENQWLLDNSSGQQVG